MEDRRIGRGGTAVEVEEKEEDGRERRRKTRRKAARKIEVRTERKREGNAILNKCSMD